MSLFCHTGLEPGLVISVLSSQLALVHAKKNAMKYADPALFAFAVLEFKATEVSVRTTRAAWGAAIVHRHTCTKRCPVTPIAMRPYLLYVRFAHGQVSSNVSGNNSEHVTLALWKLPLSPAGHDTSSL